MLISALIIAGSGASEIGGAVPHTLSFAAVRPPGGPLDCRSLPVRTHLEAVSSQMPPIVPAARRNSSAAERRRAKKKRKRAAEEADDLPPGFAAFAAEAAAGGADSDEEDGGAREPDELDEEAAAVQSVDGLDDESEGGASGGSVAAAGGGEEEEEEGREALLAQLLSPELLSLSLSEWRAESGLEILASADRPDKASLQVGVTAAAAVAFIWPCANRRTGWRAGCWRRSRRRSLRRRSGSGGLCTSLAPPTERITAAGSAPRSCGSCCGEGQSREAAER